MGCVMGCGETNKGHRMTTERPEALRLASDIAASGQFTSPFTLDAAAAELRTQHARITDLEAQLEAIGAGGVSGPLIGQPQAMPDLSQLTERGAKAWAGVDAQGLREGFTAADMATASAQGFRDGVASLSANAGEPRNAIDRDALIDAIAQGLHGTWHCTRVWEAWHVGTMSQDDFEPVDESETPTEIADAVLALLAAQVGAVESNTADAAPTQGATEMENLQRTAVGWQGRALRAERHWAVCRRWAIAGGAPVEKLGDDPDQPFRAASPAIDAARKQGEKQ